MAQLLLSGPSSSFGSNLKEALQLLDARLLNWASKTDAYKAHLLDIFGVHPSAESDALLVSISGTGLGINVGLLDAAAMGGLLAAYRGEPSGSGECIYLNATWLESATAEQVEAVLLEEVGHCIDQRLNGSTDSPGDEGEIFSALLRRKTPDPGAYSANDWNFIFVDGKEIAIEAAADTIAPTGSLGSTTPAYSIATTNPFGITDVGDYANPTLADIDGDGDLDLFVGSWGGNTLLFRNTASSGATAPAYSAATANPFGITPVVSYAKPALADIDADGDLDLVIGDYYGDTLLFTNTASSGATAPAYSAATTNPFGITDVGFYANPTLADIDGDGDLDLFIGNGDGNTLLFINTASLGASVPAYSAATTNPFGITGVGSSAIPTLADIDRDGDLDLFIGNSAGNTLLFTNIAGPGATAPAYSAETTNPFDITRAGSVSSPTFADIDRDGDLDLLIGNSDGNTRLFTNTAATPVAPVAATTSNGSYGIGSVITITVQFSEAVLVDTTGGVPTLQLETGSTDRFATYSSGSGTTILSFEYTVQAGDSSADLDQLSSNALTLNGGTIKDAAGNDAILTLAAPGAAGSLAANQALEIKDIAPTGSITPNYAAAIPNPFGINNVGYFATPALVDIDGDGDLDLFIGNQQGSTLFFLNTGSASAPAFDAATSNPFGITDVSYYATPALVDIDGDGDLDLFIGNSDGSTLFFLNTGAASAPAFAAATSNPFGITNGDRYATPTFADIDGDGDQDLFIGNLEGSTLFFLNTGAASAPAFAAATSNPFGITDVGYYATPALVDIDGDGDLDLFIGERFGSTLFFLNTGSASAPDFAAASTNPFGIISVGEYATPTFADIDGDGDLDLFIGERNGNTLFFRSAPIAPVSSTTANGTYGIGAVITLTVGFSEGVLVTGIPTLQLETGSTDRFATYSSGSGTSTLSFQYTVQAGDSSADLDQLSSNALALNGGTIKDAAGNDALLELAEPGSTESLASNAQIIIETVAPTGTLGSYATTPAYSAPSTNPFGITNVGGYASPTLTDIDADGDLDLFIGNLDGNTLLFTNTASLGAAAPAYSAAITNPFGITNVGQLPSLTFGDIDADGDLDLIIGNHASNTLLFRNTASSGATAPAYSAATTDPFGITDVGYRVNPSLVDIDADGDLDLFIGNMDGNILLFRNTASLGATAPAFGAATTNPFGITDVGIIVSPSFADIDGDGDLDLFVGNSDGNTLLFTNAAISGATAPAYSAATTNPFGITDVSYYANPALADIDGDGDLDLFIGNHYGDTLLFTNTAATTVAPVVSTTANGTYGVGAVITITVQFSEAVLVVTTGGIPTLQLETFSIDRLATYSSGSGTNTLSFQYTVQAGDSSADLDQLSSNALALNGGTIKDAAGNNAILILAAPGEVGSLAANQALVIDAATSINQTSTTTANGSYGVGKVITITVQFSEAVLVDTTGGVPTLQLETGSTDRSATYSSGSGTNTLSFQYTVQAGDSSADLDQLSSNALALNGGTIKDAAGNDAVLELAEPGSTESLASNAQIIIETVAPTGTLAFKGGSQGAFAARSNLPFGITDIGSWASPEFADIDRDGDVDLFIGTYRGNTLYFNNTAVLGSTAPSYAAGTINPFGITDIGNSASPELADIDGDGDFDLFVGTYDGDTVYFNNTAALGSTAPAYEVGTTNPFGITNIGECASPELADIDRDGDLDLFIGNGDGDTVYFNNSAALGSTAPAYAAGTTNPFGITGIGSYASPVFTDIDGDGDLDLFIGTYYGNTVYFNNSAAIGSTAPAYEAGTTNPFGITSIGYNASPVFTDIDGDGDLDLFIGNGGGNTLFFQNTAVTYAAPVTSTKPNGTYGVGTIITLNIEFSENVMVGGVPQLQLETGSTDQFATYSGGSGTSTLSFEYIVQAGDNSADLDQLSSTALTLNGGSIRDAAGNDAIITLAAPGAAGSLAANQALVISAATSFNQTSTTTADGTYGVGAVITITVQFSEAVLVVTTGGVPTLQLETGSTDRFATYSSGSGTNTLSFQYTVQAGDTSADLDQLSSSALALNGGTIKDAAGNDAILTLAAPGDAGSLAANHALVIDTIAPTGSFKPYYAAASPNPFGITNVGFYATPTLADIDGDGDLDLFIGNLEGSTLFFLNTGSTSAPSFAAASSNSFGITDVGDYATPVLVDIDGDVDFDLFIGNSDGSTLFFLNTGQPSAPAFAPATSNPFGITDVGDYSTPTFADIDGDGDLDLFIHEIGGSTLFFLNSGTGTIPDFGAATTNPFGITEVLGLAAPTFGDIDDDGDLDLFIGEVTGSTLFFLNTGSASAPGFAAASTNPFGNINVGGFAAPTFADIDGDGDLDLFIGEMKGNTLFYRSAPIAPVSSTTANGTYGLGAVITLAVQFSEALLVDTTGGVPTLQLETGSTDRFASYSSGSGTNTLTFQYTVQAGDFSTDLDQLSSNALTLNGGSIRDAAGNDAILTLAAPGEAVSLARNLALLIETEQAPTWLEISATSFNENIVAGTAVATVSTSDLNISDTFTYSFVYGTDGSDNSFFSIIDNDLRINSVPDFESKSSFEILLRTTDQGGLSFDRQVTLSVSDVNETPTALNLSASSFNEAVAAGTATATLSSLDPDDSNTFSYSLVAGDGSTDNAAFTVAGDQLIITASPDFEAKSSYAIRLRTTDQGGLSFDRQVTLSVSDVNETPTALSLSASSFNEAVAAGATVATLSSLDPDASNTYSYSLVAGDGSTDNAAFAIAGDQLKIKTSPDFETKGSYAIRLRTTDQGGLSFDRQVTLSVSDVNETPTALSLSASSFSEFVAAGATVATLSSLDHDASNTYSYSLVAGDGSSDNAAFTIAGDQLKITASPNFVTKGSYAIRLRTTDQGGLSFDRQVTLLLAKKGQTLEARDLVYTTSTGQTSSARITTASGTFDGSVSLNRLVTAPVYSNQNANLSIGKTGIAFSLNVDSNSNSKKAKLALDLAPLLDGVNITQKRLAYFVYSTPVGLAAPMATAFTYDPVKKAGARFFDLDGNGSADTADLQFVDGGYGDKDGVENGVVVDPSTAGAVDLSAIFTATANSLTVGDPTDTSSPASLLVRASLSSRSSTVNQIGYVAFNATESLSLSYDLVKERGTLLFGTLQNSDVPDTTAMSFQRDINLINGQKLMFFEVVDNTLEAMLKDGSLDSSFRTLDITKLTDASATAGKGGSSLNLFLSSGVSGLGELISSQMGEAPIFDFSSLAGQTLIGDVLIAREASYDSTIGFYKLERSDGAVRDSLTNSLILPGEAGYAAAALRSTNLFSSFGSLATSNRTNKTADLSAFKDAGLLAPFARVANTGETYFSFSAANSDGLSHFRVLGSGVLGLEDIKGGGDRDFDDLIVAFNFKLSTGTLA